MSPVLRMRRTISSNESENESKFCGVSFNGSSICISCKNIKNNRVCFGCCLLFYCITWQLSNRYYHHNNWLLAKRHIKIFVRIFMLTLCQISKLLVRSINSRILSHLIIFNFAVLFFSFSLGLFDLFITGEVEWRVKNSVEYRNHNRTINQMK